MRKITKQMKGFYSLTDCTHALKCRMVAFKLRVFCSMYKTRIMRKIIKQINSSYSLSDCTPILKCRMTAFKSPVFCSMYFSSLSQPYPSTIWPTYDSNSIICRSNILCNFSVEHITIIVSSYNSDMVSKVHIPFLTPSRKESNRRSKL